MRDNVPDEMKTFKDLDEFKRKIREFIYTNVANID